MKNIIYFCIAITTLLCCETKQTSTNNTEIIVGETGKLLDSLLTPYVNELRDLTDNNAGLAIGITKGKEIIYARTFGYANIEKNIKADFNTVFHIASVSKPFTAAAIAKLVQQEKLKLDDPIIDYIPEFEMKGEGYNKITIRHILTHTSGIPRHISSDDWRSPVFGPKALEDNLSSVKDFPLDFEPGSQYSYSNAAFDILGIVVSRASGMPFSEYVSTQILRPAGMTNSTYIKPTDSLPLKWAVSYSYGLQTQKLSPYPYNEKLLPSSGMKTTLFDMCRWGLVHLGKGSFQEYKVLDESHFNLMVSPQYETPWGDNIGLSWFLQSYLNHPIIMHTGEDPGFESIMYVYPDDDISIIIMANRNFSRTGRIINASSEILFDEKLKTYNISGKYKFTEKYLEQGINAAKNIWSTMKNDTTDIYFIDDYDLLEIGGMLENGQNWKDTKDVIEYYLTFNDKSTYAWRLLGNANLNLGDTLTALSNYKQCLKINPDYEKAKKAIKEISRK